MRPMAHAATSHSRHAGPGHKKRNRKWSASRLAMAAACVSTCVAFHWAHMHMHRRAAVVSAQEADLVARAMMSQDRSLAQVAQDAQRAIRVTPAATQQQQQSHQHLRSTVTEQCQPGARGPGPYPQATASTAQHDWPLWWMAPFTDQTSFGQEDAVMLSGALSFHGPRNKSLTEQQLWLSTTQADCSMGDLPEVCGTQAERAVLQRALVTANKCLAAVVVCHSLPAFWARPKNKWHTCQPCPPVGYTPAITIGRVMVETDRYHPEFVEQCNRMDELWVPTRFSYQVLKLSGVHKPTIRVLPIAVDTDTFDRLRVHPLPLPIGDLVFGEPQRVKVPSATTHAQTSRRLLSMVNSRVSDMTNRVVTQLLPWRGRTRPYGSIGPGAPVRARPFTFVSVFEWELRSGWDVLLSAYLQEFTAEDNAELYIVVKPVVTQDNIEEKLQAWVQEHVPLTGQQLKTLPTVYVVSSHLSQSEYRGLLRAADAFVLPTRGEGWGMPLSEAMSMSVPVIVTHWSGPQAFVDKTVGYPVKYTLKQVPDSEPWWLRGGQWAEPSVEHLRRRMREVVTWPHEAAQRGRAARQRMVARYSPPVVGQQLVREYERVKGLVRNKTCRHCQGSRWVAAPGDYSPDLYQGNESFLQPGEDVWGARHALPPHR